MATARPQVVILGAGFGGIETAKALRSAPVDVTLIDRQNHHCFQPLLYQVATAALSPADIAWPIRHILRGQTNATVLMAEITAVDRECHCVMLRDTDPMRYDILVVATVATHAYFCHDEWAEFAPGLKQIVDATRIRRCILLSFEQAELTHDDAERQRLLTFAIVGGGATGVEMAGAIAEIARLTLARDFRRIDPRTARIVLLEAGSRILPTLPPALSDYARRTLTRMGVEVLTSTPVIGCDRGGVSVHDRRIDASTIIWAAGVRASPAAEWLGAPADRAGRIIVGPDLSLREHPEIFVIGDTAAVQGPDGQPVPGIAPAAKQMGRYVAGVIRSGLTSQTHAPFRYRHAGTLATIGRRAAVVDLGAFKLTGFAGWLFWSVAHIYFLIGLRYRFLVAFMWLWDFLTFQRGARLITEVAPQPPLKAR